MFLCLGNLLQWQVQIEQCPGPQTFLLKGRCPPTTHVLVEDVSLGWRYDLQAGEASARALDHLNCTGIWSIQALRSLRDSSFEGDCQVCQK